MNEDEFPFGEEALQKILDAVKLEFPEFLKQEVLEIIQGSIELLENGQKLSLEMLQDEVKYRCLWVKTYLELMKLLSVLGQKYRIDNERMDGYVHEAALILLDKIRNGGINGSPLSYAKGIIRYLILKDLQKNIIELTENLSTMEKIEIEADVDVYYGSTQTSICMQALKTNNLNRYRLLMMHHAYSFSLKEIIAFWGEDFLRQHGFLGPDDTGELLELSDLEKARLMLENMETNKPDQEYISFLEENLFTQSSEALLIIIVWLRRMFPTWKLPAMQSMEHYRIALLQEAHLLVLPQQPYNLSIGAMISNYNSGLTTKLENRFKGRIHEGKEFLHNCINR